MRKISEHLYAHEDTCNVYVVVAGRDALLIDFGSGGVLAELPALGVERVGAVLMTHHHRDQGQGLAAAAARGIPIWVPHQEQDLFRAVDTHWQARELYNSYNNRQDRFSLLEPVPVAGTLTDYSVFTFGPYRLLVVPTPGHTVGSLSLLGEIDGVTVAFSGDLIAAPGQTWSLAAMQWGYNDACGAAAAVASLLDLAGRAPQLLLPSHGDPLPDPGPGIALLAERLRQLLDLRGENPRLFAWHGRPYQPVTRHVLWNRTSVAYSYVLLSESGKALFIDFGYDFMTGMAGGTDRAARRPWLYTLAALKRQFGVDKIDVVVPTHYHDDHVAGCNLLRQVEGTAVWAAANFADVLARPFRYNLSCLWYDPISVDRVLPLNRPIQWEEYELTLYPLPGHTVYAAAIAFAADGLRFLATGDQYQDEGYKYNYVYRNGFGPADYRAGSALYAQLAPDLILTGHWEPRPAQPAYLARLRERDELLERLHRELLPSQVAGAEGLGLGVQLRPYQATICSGEPTEFAVEVTNLGEALVELVLDLVVPAGWQVAGPERALCLPGRATGAARFCVTPPAGLTARRVRIAVDLTAAGHPAGQQAEALVTVL